MPFEGSTVVITYTPPGGSPEVITTDCIFSTWHFTSQMAATPGQFEGVVRDPDQTHSFVTGGEISCEIDGVVLWGGYVLNVTKQFAFPVDDTVAKAASAVLTRQWALSGSDYNWKLDKLVFRNTSDYTHFVEITGPIFDGALIRDHFATYFDLPGDWDFSTFVEDNFQFSGNYVFGANGNGQGFTLRDALADLTKYGAVAYMGPDKALRFKPVQDVVAPWGFSDVPDGSTFIGFRSGSATEDLTPVGNDAFVWGGSIWANDGAVVVAREQNATSITDHGRWQYAEVRVGDVNYQSQAEVDARANVIVSGNTQGSTVEGQQGISLPEQQFRLTWFGHRVPKVLGVPQHLYPGDVTTIDLWTFSEDAGATPWTVDVPLRSLDISFPNLDPAGNGYVEFSGTFGVLSSDPEWLWAFLRKNLAGFQSTVVGGAYSTAGNATTGNVPYGTIWNGEPTETPDGVVTVFSIPYGYIAGTTIVSMNGLNAILDVDYTESDPAAGEITWIEPDRSPLVTGDALWIVARLTG